MSHIALYCENRGKDGGYILRLTDTDFDRPACRCWKKAALEA
jgi:hypothetical protein